MGMSTCSISCSGTPAAFSKTCSYVYGLVATVAFEEKSSFILLLLMTARLELKRCCSTKVSSLVHEWVQVEPFFFPDFS